MDNFEFIGKNNNRPVTPKQSDCRKTIRFSRYGEIAPKKHLPKTQRRQTAVRLSKAKNRFSTAPEIGV